MLTTNLSQTSKTRKKLIAALAYLIDRAEIDITSALSRETSITFNSRHYEIIWINTERTDGFSGRSRFYIVLKAPDSTNNYNIFYGIHSQCKGSALRYFQGNPTYCQFLNAPLDDLLYFAIHLPDIIKLLESNEQRLIHDLDSAIKSLDSYVPKKWLKAWNGYPNPYNDA